MSVTPALPSSYPQTPMRRFRIYVSPAVWLPTEKPRNRRAMGSEVNEAPLRYGCLSTLPDLVLSPNLPKIIVVLVAHVWAYLVPWTRVARPAATRIARSAGTCVNGTAKTSEARSPVTCIARSAGTCVSGAAKTSVKRSAKTCITWAIKTVVPSTTITSEARSPVTCIARSAGTCVYGTAGTCVARAAGTCVPLTGSTFVRLAACIIAECWRCESDNKHQKCGAWESHGTPPS